MLENISIRKEGNLAWKEKIQKIRKIYNDAKRLNQADKNKSVRILPNGNGKMTKSDWMQLC